MQTDKELLELAALAAGLTHLNVWSEKITDHDSPHYGLPALHWGEFGGEANSWNPLVNDGDAFRLAVKLNLDVTVFVVESGIEVQVYGDYDESPMPTTEEFEKDGCSATRRAIVRYAAEIGRAKREG